MGAERAPDVRAGIIRIHSAMIKRGKYKQKSIEIGNKYPDMPKSGESMFRLLCYLPNPCPSVDIDPLPCPYPTQ